MENKYYTPTIEEFHVGFEFEMIEHNEDKCAEEKWVKCLMNVFSDGVFNKDSDGSVSVPDGVIRVKYLDREDIEECGWKQHEFYPQKNEFWFDSYHVLRYYNEKEIDIFVDCGDSVLSIFKGAIKNKSELKRIMRQLNIKAK
jgi:hypothetical protein